MADSNKYYYLKLKDDFFESDSMILLESLPDGYLYSNILLKLYLRSLKDEGRLILNGRIPYNTEMLARVTRHSAETVEKAIEALKSFGLVEVLDSGVIYMTDIQNFIGKSSDEADRKREYRKRIDDEKASGQMSGQMSGQCPPEIKKELEKESITKEKSIERDSFTAQARKKSSTELLEVMLLPYYFPPLIVDSLRKWVKFKSEKRKPCTETEITSLLETTDKAVKKYGEQKVCDVIEKSIASGYAGITWNALDDGKSKDNAVDDFLNDGILGEEIF